MKKKNPLQRLVNQFAYDHRILDSHIQRIQKSAGELNRLFGDFEAKNKKEEKK